MPSLLAVYGPTLVCGTGGIKRYAQAAVEALRRGPWAGRLAVYLPSGLRESAGEWAGEGVRWFPAPHPRRGFSFNNLFWANLLAWHLRRHEPGAAVFAPVECHALLGWRAMVMTAHDCYADRFGDPRLGGRVGLGRRLGVRELKRARRVISVSQFTTAELAALHGLREPQVATVWNWLGRDYERDPAAEAVARVRAELGLPERFWLYVGGFRRNKNLPLLLRAYAAAAGEAAAGGAGLPPLILAGEWPERDTPFTGPLNAVLAEMGDVARRVMRPGFVAEADLPALYRAAELVVCPSSYEGFGYPVVEAMAVGAPVLAARAASLPELVRGDAAVLFAADDPGELTARLGAARETAAIYRRPFDEVFGAAAGEARFNAAMAGALGEKSR